MWNRVHQRIIKHAEHSAYPYQVFGIVNTIAFPSFYLIWLYHGYMSYENLSLRVIATILNIPLIFTPFFNNKMRHYLPFYWYFTVTYSFTFLFTFLTFKNNFSTPALLNTFTILVQTILCLDLVALLFIIPTGIILGWLAYLLTTKHYYVPPDYHNLIITYSTVIILGMVFAHTRKRLSIKQALNDKMRAVMIVSANIAHELRSPLLSIWSGAVGIEKYLPNIIENSLDININKAKGLLLAANNIVTETKAANILINMLLMNTNYHNHLCPQTTGFCSIKSCVEEAITRYPFATSTEAKLVGYTINPDFIFHGGKILVVHVLLNLLKNAIFHINSIDKGEIYIETAERGNKNQLYFTDTGPGIEKKVLPHIFKQFFSGSPCGNGIGLHFCKEIMRNYGGDISCESKVGEFTKFTLTFPKLKKEATNDKE